MTKTEETKTNTEESITKVEENKTNTEESITKVTDSDSEEQTRLYFRVFGDSVDILYRPAHQYLQFVTNDDNGVLYIKALLEMSRDDFKDYLKQNIMFKSIRKKERYSERNKHMEDWYKRAWSEQTYQFLKKHNLNMPKELIIYEDELVDSRA